MQAGPDANHDRLSDRQWAYILLFNGFIYLMLDVIVLSEAIVSGKGSTLPWPYWVVLILMIPAGIGFFYFGVLRLNRARSMQKSNED